MGAKWSFSAGTHSPERRTEVVEESNSDILVLSILISVVGLLLVVSCMCNCYLYRTKAALQTREAPPLTAPTVLGAPAGAAVHVIAAPPQMGQAEQLPSEA